MIIGFAGLTHLGLVSQIASANKGVKTIGFDFDLKKVKSFEKGNFDIFEPNLVDKFKKKKELISFTNDIRSLNNCDIIYISSDTVTTEKGLSDYSLLKRYTKLICKNISKKKILVVLAQVFPGFTRAIKWPKKNLYYQVETLIFGNAFFRASSPERIIVGSFKNKLSRKYQNFLKLFKCPLINMKYESAEFSKIAVNILLSSSINTSNNLARICEIIDADWEEIKPSLQLDKRIGKHAYLKPGLGISGLNLIRDINTCIKLSKNRKPEIKYLTNLIDYSEFSREWAIKRLNSLIKKFKYKKLKLTLLGLTYKENTNSIKNSAAIDFIKKIKKHKIKVYDPLIKVVRNIKNITYADNLKNAIKNTDILLILTPWKQFSKISNDFLFNNIAKKIVIDPYNILGNKINSKKIKHYIIGKKQN